MLVKNGNVLTDSWQFEQLDLRIAGDTIAQIVPVANIQAESDLRQEPVFDAQGLYVLPGLVDIHIHGCAGYDFCDAREDSVRGMSRYLIRQGITSFVAASMAYDEECLKHVFETGRKIMESGIPGGAQLRGIHMEGPFFSKAKKGAQPEKYIIEPDIDMFDRLNCVSGGTIRLVDVAPELPRAMEFIRHASTIATVSIAHTTADYSTAMEAFGNGATHVTHLFNAMPPFSHRDPGVAGAASDAGADVEVICDGIHLHPAVIRSIFKWFGDDKVILISDAMMACGLPDGKYELGGQAVNVCAGKAALYDGTIAGSATDLYTCMKRAVEFGIPLESAVRAASFNPAGSAGLDQQIGSIATGKRADLLLLDKNLSIVQVICGGQFC
ncbi:MAG: N-acetylglucosamine-6-phosphate deacetylase [Eubacteriales bacterium]